MFSSPFQHPARKTRRSSGLTLFEILIVLATVGVVAAVVFPVFARARENARRSSCQSNLKQIGLGVMQYSRDYDEKFPRRSLSNPYLTWQQVTLPYIKSMTIFVCPSNPDAFTRPLVNRSLGPHPAVPRSYAWNARLGDIGRSVPMAEVKHPSRKIMVAESRAPWTDYASPWWKTQGWEQGFGHLETSNYLFNDGHVKAILPTATAAPFNMWGGMDGGACPNRSINCDKPEPRIQQGLKLLGW
jgi:prepilin-type processing-associated H-X9-DG protein